MTSVRAILTEALAAVYSGATETEADALLDQLADMGHTVCPDPSSDAGSIAAATAPGHPAGFSLGSPAGTSQRGHGTPAATAGRVEAPSASPAGASYPNRVAMSTPRTARVHPTRSVTPAGTTEPCVGAASPAETVSEFEGESGPASAGAGGAAGAVPSQPLPAGGAGTASSPAGRVSVRCCAEPDIEAIWGLGRGDNNIITVSCLACGTDLLSIWPQETVPA